MNLGPGSLMAANVTTRLPHILSLIYKGDSILTDFKKRLVEETLKNDPDLVAKTVQKMLIIMPESCFCATDLKSENHIEFTGKFVVRVANRAGNQKRDYKSSLYKLIDHEVCFPYSYELCSCLFMRFVHGLYICL